MLMLSHHFYLPQNWRFLRQSGIMRHGVAEIKFCVFGEKWALPLENGLKVDKMEFPLWRQ